MRGGRNGEYDGRFWRGVMTGWSKEGRRENYVEIGKWEEFREGEGRSSWAPTMETPDARTHRRSNGDGEHFARSVLAPPEEKGGQPRLACWTGIQPPTPRKLSGASEPWRHGAL
jgi:hypothetical protein